MTEKPHGAGGAVPAGPAAARDAVRASMRSNRRRDTQPELAVRRLLHASGLRYRVDFAPMTGERRRRADVVFIRQRVAVFIDGCFWHGCPAHFIAPKSNTHYWGPKIARNRERDVETMRRLEAEGWRVLRYWEHEQPTDVAEQIRGIVRGSGSDQKP